MTLFLIAAGCGALLYSLWLAGTPGRIFFAVLAAFALMLAAIPAAPARDLGQWAAQDPALSRWFQGLMQPDNPGVPCCGEADAYWADSFEIKGDRYVAIVTDERDDTPLGRPHVAVGTRIEIPNGKIKFDRGNPTGHGIVFVGNYGNVYCYLPPGGV